MTTSSTRLPFAPAPSPDPEEVIASVPRVFCGADSLIYLPRPVQLPVDLASELTRHPGHRLQLLATGREQSLG
jgi:hypothetical protein